MKQVFIGKDKMPASQVVVGAMRLAGFNASQMADFIHFALDNGVNYFDHADIYGGGRSEEVFGEALAADPSIKREDLFIQSKCAIRKGEVSYYDFSKEHIVNSVDGILKRLGVEYLDALLLHRPDALMEPEEVAAAFDELEKAGKVRRFGVSNHNPGQIALLKKCVKQELAINQLQFSICVSNMIARGMEANMDTPGSVDHDGGILDYCRLNDITIQAWSPFQMSNWRGTFLGNGEYKELNEVLDKLAAKYGVTPSAIAAAWIARHPAGIQIIAGTSKKEHLKDIIDGANITLTRPEWYEIYLSAGHILP